jgi:4-amino-4-deoxy-L-arabinose transferase-like glycosyltransferase
MCRIGNQHEVGVPFWLHRIVTLSNSAYVWWVVCLVCAGMYAWVDRHSMGPDGMSYLDMASESLKSGPSNLINGYWSPLYPALISLTLSILRPPSSLEFPVVHLTNFLVFCVTLLCFTFFVRSWAAIQQDGPATEHSGIPHLIPFCFCIFFWFTMEFTRPSNETPDLCVTAIVFLAAAICCRMCLLGSKWKYILALGAVLGLGYYAKAVMFPVGLILLAVLLVLPPPAKGTRLKVALAGLVFLIVVAPLTALVSKRVGHLSTGETGPINYALYVNGLPLFPSWTPDSANGTPEHPPRTLLFKPIILEFAAPVKGTNPYGYDPSYWFAGARVRFDLRQQWAALKTNLRSYLGFLSSMVGICSGALMLFLLNPRRGLQGRPDNGFWWLILWPATTCGVYALVHVEPRFLTGFLVIFWLALYARLGQGVDHLARTAVLGTVCFVLLVPTAVHILKASAHGFMDKPDYILVGEALQAAGIHQGDSLAAAGGYDYESGGRVYRESSAWKAYYAHYVGARIVALIVDADDGRDMPQRQAPEFWHLSGVDLARVKGVLAGIGVKAIVALDRPADSTPADWQQVIGTPYSILLVKASDAVK